MKNRLSTFSVPTWKNIIIIAYLVRSLYMRESRYFLLFGKRHFEKNELFGINKRYCSNKKE